jgi:TetR/AcrR family transcriptional repressor of nem operon
VRQLSRSDTEAWRTLTRRRDLNDRSSSGRVSGSKTFGCAVAKPHASESFLERAMLTFWARGYEGTSISDLVASTAVNRGSIYNAFSGKRDIFLAVLKSYDEHHRAGYLAQVAGQESPRLAIVRVFEAAAAGDPDGETPPGCLLVNTALECSPHDPEIAELVRSSLHAVEQFFTDMLARAVSAQELPATTSANSTARGLLGMFIGLRVLSRAGVTPAVRDSIVSQAKEILGL